MKPINMKKNIIIKKNPEKLKAKFVKYSKNYQYKLKSTKQSSKIIKLLRNWELFKTCVKKEHKN